MIADHPSLKRPVLAEFAEMDGFEAWDAAGRVFVRTPHRHHPDDAGLVEIRATCDLDALLNQLRSCIWSECRQAAALAEGARP